MAETRCLRSSGMCFSRFSCRWSRAVEFFELAVLKCERAVLEPDEKRHIRAVARALEHTDRSRLHLTGIAKIQSAFRANALADFHMRWFGDSQNRPP